MKADPAVQQALLELADADAELARVEHRRRTLPEHAEVAAAEQAVRTNRDTQVSIQATLTDLDREVRRQEREIEAVRARQERDRALLSGGTVSAKQLTDIEHEVVTLQRRQSALEDDLLELMERREAVELDGRHAGVQLAKAEEALADARHRAGERAGLLPRFPEPLLSVYERVRAAKGIGAALLRARRCGACRLELDRSALSRITSAAADEMITCDECGAILVRTAASGL